MPLLPERVSESNGSVMVVSEGAFATGTTDSGVIAAFLQPPMRNRANTARLRTKGLNFTSTIYVKF